MNLLETFERLDVKGIAQLTALGQEEHLHLDFKTVNHASFRARMTGAT
jgi:hypothetical protein